jgi:molecular chaperone DnaJ
LALGTRLTVPTVDGDVDMTVPEGTQPGQTFRLRGKGIRNSLRGTQGDEYVKIEGIVPTNLDRAQKDALKRLKESLAGR